jgi:hypothetical protein
MRLYKGGRSYSVPALGQDDDDDDDETDLDAGNDGSSDGSSDFDLGNAISTGLTDVQQVAATAAAVEAAIHPPTVIVKKAVVPVGKPISPLVWIVGGVAAVGLIAIAVSSE